MAEVFDLVECIQPKYSLEGLEIWGEPTNCGGKYLDVNGDERDGLLRIPRLFPPNYYQTDPIRAYISEDDYYDDTDDDEEESARKDYVRFEAWNEMYWRKAVEYRLMRRRTHIKRFIGD